MTAGRGKVKISGRLSGSLYHPNWRNNRKLTLITHFALVSLDCYRGDDHYGPLGGRHDGEPTPTRRRLILFFRSVPNGRQTNVNFVPQFRTTCRPRTAHSGWGTLSILFSQGRWKINGMSRVEWPSPPPRNSCLLSLHLPSLRFIRRMVPDAIQDKSHQSISRRKDRVKESVTKTSRPSNSEASSFEQSELERSRRS